MPRCRMHTCGACAPLPAAAAGTVEGISFQPRDVPTAPVNAKLGAGELIPVRPGPQLPVHPLKLACIPLPLHAYHIPNPTPDPTPNHVLRSDTQTRLPPPTFPPPRAWRRCWRACPPAPSAAHWCRPSWAT